MYDFHQLSAVCGMLFSQISMQAISSWLFRSQFGRRHPEKTFLTTLSSWSVRCVLLLWESKPLPAIFSFIWCFVWEGCLPTSHLNWRFHGVATFFDSLLSPVSRTCQAEGRFSINACGMEKKWVNEWAIQYFLPVLNSLFARESYLVSTVSIFCISYSFLFTNDVKMWIVASVWGFTSGSFISLDRLSQKGK